MLHQAFNEVYTKFKLHFYQEIFRRFQDREASLTTVETFCMESIMALGRPTVNEFATFMCIGVRACGSASCSSPTAGSGQRLKTPTAACVGKLSPAVR